MFSSSFFSYLKAGYLLHLITIFEICLLWLMFYLFPVFDWMMQGYFIFKFLLIFIFVTAPLFPQLDARSRFQNYKLIKDHLYLYGFQPRILKPFIKSRCQRDAALAAASELGLANQCKNFFKEKGYRWYHLFPDVTLAKPKILLTKIFWTTTLFTETYHPKVDFKTLNLNADNAENVLVSAC